MKIKPTILSVTLKLMITSSLVISTFSFAQESSTSQPAKSYGENPNLIKVLAVKAQEKIQSTAERVGAATERGVTKIKPTVDNTWQNVIQTISGSEEVPIQRSTLSQTNAPLNNPSLPITTTNSGKQQINLASQSLTVQPAPALKNTADAIKPTAVITQNQAEIPTIKSAPSTPKYDPEFSESEIKRQSISMPNSSAKPTASTVQPTNSILNQSNQPTASTQNPASTPVNSQLTQMPNDKTQDESQSSISR